MRNTIRRWPVQDAKARLSEMILAAMKEGPQMITKRGEDAVVMVSVREWHEMQHLNTPTLKELLTSDLGRTDELTPPRGTRKRRTVVAAE